MFDCFLFVFFFFLLLLFFIRVSVSLGTRVKKMCLGGGREGNEEIRTNHLPPPSFLFVPMVEYRPWDYRLPKLDLFLSFVSFIQCILAVLATSFFTRKENVTDFWGIPLWYNRFILYRWRLLLSLWVAEKREQSEKRAVSLWNLFLVLIFYWKCRKIAK